VGASVRAVSAAIGMAKWQSTWIFMTAVSEVSVTLRRLTSGTFTHQIRLATKVMRTRHLISLSPSSTAAEITAVRGH
jgi:hypothetical protein